MASKIYYTPSPSSMAVDTVRSWFMSHRVTRGLKRKVELIFLTSKLLICVLPIILYFKWVILMQGLAIRMLL